MSNNDAISSYLKISLNMSINNLTLLWYYAKDPFGYLTWHTKFSLGTDTQSQYYLL